jgi:hypothetical protein
MYPSPAADYFMSHRPGPGKISGLGRPKTSGILRQHTQILESVEKILGRLHL